MPVAQHFRPQIVSHDEYDPDLTIIDLFLAQAAARPHAVALIDGGRRVAYRDLSRCAAAIARVLAARGVTGGARVAVLAERGLGMVAAQLGTVALGAAFTPLDPRNPAPHLVGLCAELAPALVLDAHDDPETAARLQDAGLKVEPVARALAEQCGDGLERIVAELGRRVGGGEPACVIFTSGSTGRPKGVVIPHRAICRLVRGQDFADFGPDQVILNVAAPGFDVCVGQIYAAILNGGTLAVVPGGLASLDAIADVIAATGATQAGLTPGIFNLLVDHRPDALGSLSKILCAGDVLSEAHVARFLSAHPGTRLVNAYGPTENGVYSTAFTVDDSWRGGPIPIGRALARDHVFVLDDMLRPAPAGQIGQLAVAGDGLALGYLGRPDLTAEKFVEIAVGDFAGRVYLTGDLVSDRGDGVLLFHGRADRQVKINGVRVELDAVEHALRRDPAVGDAAAFIGRRPDGSTKIVAVVRPAEADAARSVAAEILGRMRETSPAAMVPAELHLRASLPMTPSEKIDRRALEAEYAPARPASPVPPVVDVEAAVRETWAAALGRADIPADATFFDLGGSSMQLIAVHAALQSRLGRTFDIVRFFEAPRFADLVRLLSRPPASPDVAAGGADVAARGDALARARLRRGGR